MVGASRNYSSTEGPSGIKPGVTTNSKNGCSRSGSEGCTPTAKPNCTSRTSSQDTTIIASEDMVLHPHPVRLCLTLYDPVGVDQFRLHFWWHVLGPLPCSHQFPAFHLCLRTSKHLRPKHLLSRDLFRGSTSHKMTSCAACRPRGVYSRPGFASIPREKQPSRNDSTPRVHPHSHPP